MKVCNYRIIFVSLLVLAMSITASRAGTLAQFRTLAGTMLVELYDEDKPVTVDNFIRLTEAGAYTYSFIHRANPGFVIQGGGYRRYNNAYWHVPYYGPITNEYDVGREYSNIYGTIAMAKVGEDPDSATSQWFFNLADNSANLDHQNGGFTVFGRVISGIEVLEYFNAQADYEIIDYTNTIQGVTHLPVTNDPPEDGGLFYTGIYILRTHVNVMPDNSRNIQWITALGATNYLESATSLTDADWQLVVATSTTDSISSYIDTNAVTNIFYRLRVDTD